MKNSLYLFIGISLLLCIPHIALSKIINVSKADAISTIKNAIKFASQGDTILVQPGIYFEKNLIIDKSIVLIGINFPRIDGEKKYEVISIKANNVTLNGFIIQHSGYSTLEDPAGIKIYDSKNVLIENNVIDDTFFGIYAQYSTSCIIKNNKLTSYGKQEQEIGNGIHCWKSDSMQIIANTITGHRDGIYFEFVTNSVIWRNVSQKNIRYGLHFMFSHNDAYISNVFSENGAGVAVMYTHKVKMFNNIFELNWGDAAFGLLLKEISDSYIEGNRFLKNTSAIYMEGVNRVELKNNILQNNGWALKIQASCMDVTVKNNNFIGNTFDVGTNGTLVLNTFNNNYWDKYEGYDLNKDAHGDVPYRPISMFSMIIENNPQAMMLFRSIIVSLLDKTEKVVPTLIPENLKDESPFMKPVKL